MVQFRTFFNLKKKKMAKKIDSVRKYLDICLNIKLPT